MGSSIGIKPTNKGFIYIHLNDGIIDHGNCIKQQTDKRLLFSDSRLELYNSQGEVYLKKEHILSFYFEEDNTDYHHRTGNEYKYKQIKINTSVTHEDSLVIINLQFIDNDEEFERIKRELLE